MKPRMMSVTFIKNKPVLRQLRNQSPWFMYSHKNPGTPKENQAPNRALTNPSRSLKLGMDSAMIQAMVQVPKPRAIQEPVATRPRLCRYFVPANMRR